MYTDYVTSLIKTPLKTPTAYSCCFLTFFFLVFNTQENARESYIISKTDFFFLRSSFFPSFPLFFLSFLPFCSPLPLPHLFLSQCQVDSTSQPLLPSGVARWLGLNLGIQTKISVSLPITETGCLYLLVWTHHQDDPTNSSKNCGSWVIQWRRAVPHLWLPWALIRYTIIQTYMSKKQTFITCIFQHLLFLGTCVTLTYIVSVHDSIMPYKCFTFYIQILFIYLF